MTPSLRLFRCLDSRLWLAGVSACRLACGKVVALSRPVALLAAKWWRSLGLFFKNVEPLSSCEMEYFVETNL